MKMRDALQKKDSHSWRVGSFFFVGDATDSIVATKEVILNPQTHPCNRKLGGKSSPIPEDSQHFLYPVILSRVWQEEENESLRIRLKRLARPDAKAAENMVSLSWTSHEQFRNNIYLAIRGDLFGMVKWPFQKLSDLQLGNEKVTLYHLLSRSKNHEKDRMVWWDLFHLFRWVRWVPTL